jgi:IS5 family transposase
MSPTRRPRKDTNARWTLKIGGKIRYRPDGTPLPQIALAGVRLQVPYQH